MTLAAVAAGLTVSTVRWALLDTLLHATGIPRPKWDFSRLQGQLGAYRILEDNHYKYYQFHANMFIALITVWIVHRVCLGITVRVTLLDLAFLVLAIIFFAGSRDTLSRYYDRTTELLAEVTPVGSGSEPDTDDESG